jgi:beta-mannosidase
MTSHHRRQSPIESLFGSNTSGTTLDFDDTSEATFRRVIFLSQLAQTMCIKTYLEELRRGEQTFGSLIWQLNDVWQASSWGSLDYGGRWRALHHSLQGVFAPTMASIWLDGVQQVVNVYGSHHGALLADPAADGTALLVEINVTRVATGAVTQSHTVRWTPASTATVHPLMQLPLAVISMQHEVVTTRLLAAATGLPVLTSETVHQLLPPAQMEWGLVPKSALAVSVSSVSASSASVTLMNKAAAPLFYVLVTSTLAGRFDRNVLYFPPGAARTIAFLFPGQGAEAGAGAAAVPTQDEVLQSLSVDWLNKL